MSSEGFQAG
ncbi:unnamed protein product [Acanthoscelides obtectus]|uniref:Uncharacterized protein n=1 Tax=Acanthoscelides obtectus TaxID=200917 RepID=A0A9P0PS93_ACAOB|nr:unnamed protein product [Acanthoscelides obtectus]CAK1636163.1 hypothetical protein AOBTE_LOCUS9771 [Acanthoscelides obtectus]